jgi:hypothetical protein
MSLDSDVKINVSRFSPSSIPEDVASRNRQIQDAMGREPKWYEVNLLFNPHFHDPGVEVYFTNRLEQLFTGSGDGAAKRSCQNPSSWMKRRRLSQSRLEIPVERFPAG